MKTITIKMHIHGKAQDVQIEAKQIIGTFAIHREITRYEKGVQYSDRRWAITDTHTGLVICHTKSINDARTICREIMKLCNAEPFHAHHPQLKQIRQVIMSNFGLYY